MICGQSSASTAERPFGLVVLLQATSVLSHQHTRTEPLQLPVDEESSQQLRSRLRHNRAAFVDSRHDRLANTFENVSVSDIRVEDGVRWGGAVVMRCRLVVMSETISLNSIVSPVLRIFLK